MPDYNFGCAFPHRLMSVSIAGHFPQSIVRTE